MSAAPCSVFCSCSAVAGAAAAVIAAGVALAVLVIVMIAGRAIAVAERARQQRRNRLIAAALHAGIELDAKAAQRSLSAAADAAADQRIGAVHHQHARQRAVTAARRIQNPFGNDLAFLNLIELELRTVPKVLENLSVIVSDRNLHMINLLFPSLHGSGAAQDNSYVYFSLKRVNSFILCHCALQKARRPYIMKLFFTGIFTSAKGCVCLKKLFVYLKGYGRECVLGPLFKLLEASFELIIPLVVASIIDGGILRGDRGHIVLMVGVMALLGFVGLASAVTAQFFAAKAAIGFSTRLRHALMAHIQSLSYTEIDRLGTSTLITRMTSDVNQVQSGVNMCLRLLLRSPFVVFGAMVMAFTIDFDCALIFAGVIAVLCVIVFSIMLGTVPMYRRVQGQLDSVTAATRENLNGVRVIRAFCKEDAEKEKFEKKNSLLSRMQQAVGRVSAALNPLTYVAINAAVILLIHSGAVRVQMGSLTQGEVVALYNYMSQILVELVKMANLIILLTKAWACGDRIAAVMDVRSSQQDGDQAMNQDARGSVVFEDVSLQYAGAGAESLSGVSFAVRPGQTVGVIGGTGCGKTSLVNLIPRFYDATSGRVLVGGTDVRKLKKEALRNAVAVVPQKAVLFKGTIRSNLLWGNERADDAELNEALAIAQALDVVSSRPLGLDEPVEQGGRNFSGGQRQRLTIARALVKKPDVLILDDSASALDYATDASLRRAIRGMDHRPTTFIVSQRASSVRFADLIIVLDDGRVAGMGTHEALLAGCPVYQEIYASQFSGEEVASRG